MSEGEARVDAKAQKPGGSHRGTGGERGQTLAAYGEPMLWLTGGGLAASLLMIIGLLALVLWQGLFTFWPQSLVELHTHDGRTLLGEVSRVDSFRPEPGFAAGLESDAGQRASTELEAADGFLRRQLLRTGNYDLTGEHFNWVSEYEIEEATTPAWALLIERMTWGRFYGYPKSFLVEGEATATEPEAVWAEFTRYHEGVRERRAAVRELEVHEIGAVNRRLEAARLDLRGVLLASGKDSATWVEAKQSFDVVEAEASAAFDAIREEIDALEDINDRYVMVLSTTSGDDKELPVAEIVRAIPSNRLSTFEKLGVYLSRWGEFLSDEPREANSEGGVWPAIFGTVVMTLIMSVLVTPFGVLAALYLREYARQGVMVSAVRIAVNNLAGVPSIVFGVFGLGFFSYIVGASIDELFFSSKLPSPTFGTGGILWASLTLALLTLPVVIVATEEALAAVPGSMREGSYACGASKWQTIQRIVLPRAMPGIMTGVILAIARGAGEVAPLMLVGAVKLAPELPLDGVFPFVHMERSFMHLGFHIYDLGFQSQNSEAAKPMVFTTTLLLIGIVAALNLAAIWLRGRLRKRFVTSQF